MWPTVEPLKMPYCVTQRPDYEYRPELAWIGGKSMPSPFARGVEELGRALGEVAERVGDVAVFADLEVEVVAGGVAGAAAEAYDLALADGLASADADLREMGVEGREAVGVLNDDVEAVGAAGVAA